MGTTPTTRTLAHLRKIGYTAGVTEKWNMHARVRQDLFGFVDLVYLADSAIVAVQTTSGSNHAARRTKILGIDAARKWLASGGRIEVWSWRAKKIKRGGVAVKYEPRIEPITLEDFADAAETEE